MSHPAACVSPRCLTFKLNSPSPGTLLSPAALEDAYTADLDELAADAGMEDLPSHGGGQQVVARLSAESKASPGGDVELSLDTSQIKLFDAGSGRSLSTAA